MRSCRSWGLALLATLVLAMFTPLASANPGSTVNFTADPHPAGPFFTVTREDSTEGGAQVNIPQRTPVVWAMPEILHAGADVSGRLAEVDLYFTRHHGDKGGSTVTASYGYVKDGVFTALGSGTAPIERVPRGVLNVTRDTLGVLDIGHAAFEFALPAGSEVPAGSYPAVAISTEDPNALYAGPSLLGTSSQSSAFVPLPELSPVLLMAAGLAVVGGVVLVRTRKEAN